MTATTASVELPVQYEQLQEFLPEYDVAVNLVLCRLAVLYKLYIEKGGTSQPSEIIKLWLERCQRENDSRNESMNYYENLREIIEDVLSKTGVSYENEAFITRIQEQCDDYGYEDHEDPDEVVVEQAYAERAALIDAIQEYIESLDTNELTKLLGDEVMKNK